MRDEKKSRTIITNVSRVQPAHFIQTGTSIFNDPANPKFNSVISVDVVKLLHTTSCTESSSEVLNFTVIPLQVRGEYCSFYSTTCVWQLSSLDAWCYKIHNASRDYFSAFLKPFWLDLSYKDLCLGLLVMFQISERFHQRHVFPLEFSHGFN